MLSGKYTVASSILRVVNPIDEPEHGPLLGRYARHIVAATQVFLIGGGWTAAGYPLTYGPFVQAASPGGMTRIACVLLDHPERDDYFGMVRFAFDAAGTSEVYPVFVSAERPLLLEDVEGATGIFISAGHTPGYHDAIVPSAAGWLRDLVQGGIPYAGNSAGAMIAPATGITGGWKMTLNGTELEICSQEVSEEEDELDIRAGLGLVPFAVDPHAAQFGTPTRLLHAVNAGSISEGWAIDEDTVLIVRDGDISVAGFGAAWHVFRQDGRLVVDIVSSQEQ
jgi:cyanophycinase